MIGLLLALALTVRTGDTWLFSIDHGEPVRAGIVDAAA
jgi:hypothetical protein